MQHFFKRLLLTWLVAVTALPASAWSANLSWINAAGGTAGTAANWNPAQVPAAADWLNFDINNSYTTTFGVAVPQSDHFGVGDGSPTLRFSTPHTVGTVFAVFNVAAGPTPAATISFGDLSVLRNFYIGHENIGTLTLSGTETNVTYTAPLDSIDFTESLQIGRSGEGTVSVVSGARLYGRVPPQLASQGGIGTLVISGGGVSPFIRRSTVEVDYADTDLLMGKGDATVDVSNGALLDLAGGIQMASGSLGTATMTVVGESAFDSARVTLGGDLRIASQIDGSAEGTATFTVDSRGAVNVGDSTITVDDVAGGLGRLVVKSGGRFTTKHLILGEPANELDLLGGLLQVKGGTLSTSGRALRLNSTAGTPTLELLSGTQSTLGSNTLPTLRVGNAGSAVMRVLGGSDLVVNDFNAVIGDLAGGNGTLDLVGVGSTLNTEKSLVVGQAGTGAFNQRSGAEAELGDLRVATLNGSSGAVVIEDAGTLAHVSGEFAIGGTATAPGTGVGTVTVRDSALLSLDGSAGTTTVWPGSTLFLSSGGAMEHDGVFEVRGRMTLSNGKTLGGTILPVANGIIAASGDMLSRIHSGTDTTGHISTSGGLPLSLGMTVPDGYDMLGTLTLGGATVTLRDADSAMVGRVTLSGGTLNPPAGGAVIAADHALTGFGTVNGNLTPRGRIVSSGASGLRLGGKVTGTGQGMSGDKFIFLAGSRFEGFGPINASVQIDSGATVEPNGTTTLGNAPIASTVAINGRLVATGIPVLFSATDTVRVGGTVKLTAGAVGNPGTNLRVKAGGRLQGTGNVVANTVVSGSLAPGNSAGKLIVVGSLQMNGDGRLEFELGNPAIAEQDTVICGPAALAGTLDLRFLPSFAAAVGDSFQILACTSRTGTFSNVTLNGVPAAGMLDVHYRNQSVWVVVLPGIVDVPGAGNSAAGVRELRFASVASPGPAPAFALDLPRVSRVSLELFDVSGRRLTTLHEGTLAAGRHRFESNAAQRGIRGMCFARARVWEDAWVTTRTARVVVMP
ncbi:MAG: hypothetical protein HOP12_13120 [Candidatus Eisenbacteria bacterium]|uniref:Uncharacterized protein n=1 Tax=Eiseniibacteriota bacterium TaxID=2212470 RepID=A0A849SSP7_UNCEI|nr:hypothetical protein [Candidatus Eisenbacteria bacterium]